MALMYCPKCGKKVSDTVEKCIHCGAALNVKSSEFVDDKLERFENLSKYEQDKIVGEYSEVNAGFVKNRKAIKKLGILKYVFMGTGLGGIFLGFIIVLIQSQIEFPFNMGIIGFVLMMLGVVFGIATGVIRMVLKRMIIESGKYCAEFKAWLRETKNLDWGYNTDVANK